jgi:phosphopantetheinyl transferase
VGVDGERLDRRCNLERLGPRLLSEQQRADLASLPADQQHAFLLRQWCRLEAQLKCGGEGLAGLEALRQAKGSRNLDLQLVELALPAGYCGALAWRHHSMEAPLSR